MTFKVLIQFMKNVCLHNLDILENIIKIRRLTNNISQKKIFTNFKMTLCDLCGAGHTSFYEKFASSKIF